MRTPIFTNKFQRDIKRCKKRGLNMDHVKVIMDRLINNQPLDQKNKNHQLSGDYVDCYECHICPDWLLIYMLDDESNAITFVRTGTHSYLF